MPFPMEDFSNNSGTSCQFELNSTCCEAYRYLIPDCQLPPYAPPANMPHTSRNKRFSKPKSKKATLDLGDGWSRVEYGYRADDKGSTLRMQMNLPPLDKELTVEKMAEEHEKIKARWAGSEHRKKLAGLLDQKIPGKEWGVKKAVCIALGSLSVEWHTRIRSVWQFAFFMDIVDLLQARTKEGENIKVFVQEPRFTELDEQFFKSMDITVLEDPGAEAEVGDDCFVFAPHLEWSSEVPYLQQGVDAPLYITSSAEWIYDEAERLKGIWDQQNEPEHVKECDDAMAAATALRANHHESRFDEETQMVDSLGFSYYILKDREELDDELVSKIEALNV